MTLFSFLTSKVVYWKPGSSALLSHPAILPLALTSTPMVSTSTCMCLDSFLQCARPAWNLLQTPNLANSQSTFSLRVSQRHFQCRLPQTQVLIFPAHRPQKSKFLHCSLPIKLAIYFKSHLWILPFSQPISSLSPNSVDSASLKALTPIHISLLHCAAHPCTSTPWAAEMLFGPHTTEMVWDHW